MLEFINIFSNGILHCIIIADVQKGEFNDCVKNCPSMLLLYLCVRLHFVKNMSVGTISYSLDSDQHLGKEHTATDHASVLFSTSRVQRIETPNLR